MLSEGSLGRSGCGREEGSESGVQAYVDGVSVNEQVGVAIATHDSLASSSEQPLL